MKLKLMLDSVDIWILAQPSLIDKSKRALLPVVRERLALVGQLQSLLRDLGLERKARDVTDLHAYLAAKQGPGTEAAGTLPADGGHSDPLRVACDDGTAHRPARTPRGLTDPTVRAEAKRGRAFWQGPLAPVAALLPAGVDPKRLRQMPPTYCRACVRAVRGEASLREAVKMQCAECCGWDREAVTTCPALACPLWRYRPWQKRRDCAPGTENEVPA